MNRGVALLSLTSLILVEGSRESLSITQWGSDVHNDNIPHIENIASEGVTAVASNECAYAALTFNGSSVATWGDPDCGGSYIHPESSDDEVVWVGKSNRAFASLFRSGRVYAWGDENYGGNVSAVANSLAKGLFTAIYSTSDSEGGAFIAIQKNGSIITWGHPLKGGNSSTVQAAVNMHGGVAKVAASSNAFAVITKNGSVITWGYRVSGGDSSTVEVVLSKNTISLYSNYYAFTAVLRNGTAVSWGNPFYGGEIPVEAKEKLSGSNVLDIYSTSSAFVAVLEESGGIVSWGDLREGGNCSTVAAALKGNVARIYSNEKAFAAVTSGDGMVVTWGRADHGGDSSYVAFRASALTISSTKNAFAATLSDGSVVAWGAPTSGGNMQSIASYLQKGVYSVVATCCAFGALVENGRIVTWGSPKYGGNSQTVEAMLREGIQSLHASTKNMAALNLHNPGDLGKTQEGDFLMSLAIAFAVIAPIAFVIGCFSCWAKRSRIGRNRARLSSVNTEIFPQNARDGRVDTKDAADFESIPYYSMVRRSSDLTPTVRWYPSDVPTEAQK